MERLLFDTQTATRTGRRALTLPVSLAVHAAVVAGALIVPLLGDNVLPPVAAAPRVFFTEPPALPTVAPPPAAPATRLKATTVRAQVSTPSRFVAPTVIPETPPEDIDTEVGLPGGDPNGGVIGGDPTATAPMGAVVGGIPLAPTVTKPIPISRGIREPRKLRYVAPVYPPLAIQAGVQGTVIVECTIDATGRVVNAMVVQGNPLLNDAARDAVLQWVYTPTLLSGVPVPVLLRASVTFTLQH